jgi:hypothetical protein
MNGQQFEIRCMFVLVRIDIYFRLCSNVPLQNDVLWAHAHRGKASIMIRSYHADRTLDMTCSHSKLQGQLRVSRSHWSIAQWLNVAKGL